MVVREIIEQKKVSCRGSHVFQGNWVPTSVVVFGDRRNIIIPIYGYDLLFPVYNLTPQPIWKGVFLIKDPTAQI